jgi:Ubiquitin carboxyl-terminal hydrolases
MSMQSVNDGLYVPLSPLIIAFFINHDPLQFENSLRRHNYVGLIHSLALALAKAGRLDAATDGARTAMRKRIGERRKKGRPMDEE